MNLPIKSGEEIEVEVETETNSPFDNKKKYKFIIYKLTDKVMKNQLHYQYKLCCATKGFLTNQSKRISKTYDNKKPEEIVDNICSEFLNGKLKESNESEVNYHIIIPNWSPFVAAWWCAKLAIIKGRCDYIFYMMDLDKYAFVSIEEMYKKKSGIKLSQKPTGFRNDSGDFEDDYSTIITRYATDDYDGIGNLASGYYKTKLLSFDFVNKKWESKTFSFGDDIEEDKKKKNWDIFDNAEEANVSFLPKHPGHHQNPTILDYVTDWHTSRKNNLMKLEQNKLTVQIPGGAGIWEILGKEIEVEMPSQEDQSSEPLDKYYKGSYLVTHICQIITSDTFTVNMELCKKRLEKKMG